ncbi:putative chromatin regulator PHD family [Arabidopsis thaliana]|uniref:Phorbol-ester/DAG-type domain-containing protein n=1 Tax=Arabidopsis thaliana TaxID=3702 RepID=A0A178VQW3_ARATH|nr:hypothetical protein AXX17_AT2G01650 [Arabidopsis thaliana]
MDLFGEFRKVEIDGKPFLVYHKVMKPLPQIHTPNSSDEETTIEKPLSIQNEETSSDEETIDSGDNLPLPLLFACPIVRLTSTVIIDNITLQDDQGKSVEHFFNLKTSPFHGDNTSVDHDPVLPLFWCNNKEADPENDCVICKAEKVGTDYYYCVECDMRYHKECVESPLRINYPSHANHSFQLYSSKKRFKYCIMCRKKVNGLVYYCALCDMYMHTLCAQAVIPFFIDQPKRHAHILTLFPRQASLTCNICGVLDELHFTYVCPICDFVTHADCIYIPQTIRISRHHHCISFTSSLLKGKWSCGVCRQEVNRKYGAYTCNACNGYTVHTRCALRNDIWDGKELEGVQEDEEVEPPFKRISDGIILHFSHGCQMELETSGVHVGGNKFCQACALPINEENFYICVECDFILHETCAEAPQKKFHPLHPHALQQKVVHENDLFLCDACDRLCNGFGYECTFEDCDYILDVVCASASEPFNYQGHQHPLFLALRPNVKPMCHICKSTKDNQVLNCIEGDFIICFECATLPYVIRYKHDDHYLTLCHGEEASDSDWCELCEGKLSTGGEKGFYKCDDCCTTLHINCLLGPNPFLKPGQTFTLGRNEFLVIRNNSPRPICGTCNMRRPYPVMFFWESVSSYRFLCSPTGCITI